MTIPETKVLNKYSQSPCGHLFSSIYRIVFAHTGTRTIRADWIKIVGSLTGRIVMYKDPLCPNFAATTRRRSTSILRGLVLGSAVCQRGI